MKIAILDDYQDVVKSLDCFTLLQQHDVKVFTNTVRGVVHLAIRLKEFDALVLIRERTHISASLLSKLPKLKVISQTGKVSGNIDMAAAEAHGVRILEGAGDPTAPAELTWALIMVARRKLLPYAMHLQTHGLWQCTSLETQHNTLGQVLKGQTLGIWGYGKIGRLIASYGKAFGMHILVWGRAPSREQAVADGYASAESQAEFFSMADVLTLHLRLNDATRGCVSAADLARMKPSALFVNTSRAELVAAGALEQALILGCPGSAAIDVYESEPLAADSPLLRMPNVLATPHLGYVEKNSYELYFRIAFQNLVDHFTVQKDIS
jgi:D-3-phosphoglycerate dehydrogenase / 2-oxoglutarate reductase